METLNKTNEIILSPDQVAKLDDTSKLNMANQVAVLLTELGGKHMFHPDPHKIMTFMNARHTMLIADAGLTSAHGFIKIDPWIIPQPGITEDDIREMGLFYAIEHHICRVAAGEVGSLVVAQTQQNKGYGKQLVNMMSEKGFELYPHQPLIAVVTNDNTPSLSVFNKLDWRMVSPQYSENRIGIDVLEGWEPPSTIFFHPSSTQE